MKNHRKKWGVFFNAFMVMTFLLFANLVSAQDYPKFEVSLGITFSGPNPRWVIEDHKEITQLQEFIVGLPATSPVDIYPAGAFLIYADRYDPLFPKSIFVLHGVIKVVKIDGTSEFFRDTKGLRGFLVNKAIEQHLEVPVPEGIQGDLDSDGDIDQDDINILLTDRNKSVSESHCGIRCDFDSDGKITALDARKLTLLCTRPRCATK